MKRLGAFILTAALATVCGTAFAAGNPAQGGQAHKKNMCTGTWLEHTRGARTEVKDLKDGVEVLILSQDPAVAAKLQKQAPDYYAKKKDTNCECCAAAITGVSTVVESVYNGVKVTITAQDPQLVKKIKTTRNAMFPMKTSRPAPAASAKKPAKWICPMDKYESDKPGKCPKCGMQMVEKNAK